MLIRCRRERSRAPDTDLLGEIEPIFEHFHRRYAEALTAITDSEDDI